MSVRQFTMTQQTSNVVSALKHAILNVQRILGEINNNAYDRHYYNEIIQTYKNLLSKIEQEKLDIRLVSREY